MPLLLIRSFPRGFESIHGAAARTEVPATPVRGLLGLLLLGRVVGPRRRGLGPDRASRTETDTSGVDGPRSGRLGLGERRDLTSALVASRDGSRASGVLESTGAQCPGPCGLRGFRIGPEEFDGERVQIGIGIRLGRGRRLFGRTVDGRDGNDCAAGSTKRANLDRRLAIRLTGVLIGHGERGQNQTGAQSALGERTSRRLELGQNGIGVGEVDDGQLHGVDGLRVGLAHRVGHGMHAHQDRVCQNAHVALLLGVERTQTSRQRDAEEVPRALHQPARRSVLQRIDLGIEDVVVVQHVREALSDLLEDVDLIVLPEQDVEQGLPGDQDGGKGLLGQLSERATEHHAQAFQQDVDLSEHLERVR